MQHFGRQMAVGLMVGARMASTENDGRANGQQTSPILNKSPEVK